MCARRRRGARPAGRVRPGDERRVGEDPDDFVAVGPGGVVTTWAWVHAPRPKHPLDRPFAWALIRLDGADTAHAARGRRRRARRRCRRACGCGRAGVTERVGQHPRHRLLRAGMSEPHRASRSPNEERRTGHQHHRRRSGSTTRITAGSATQRFLAAWPRASILGQRCPECRKVYVPPRGCVPDVRRADDDEVEVPDKGTVTTFCVVNIPSRVRRRPSCRTSARRSCSTAPTLPFFGLIQACRRRRGAHGHAGRGGVGADELNAPTLESIK